MVLLNLVKLQLLWEHLELGKQVKYHFYYLFLGLLNIVSCRIPPKGKMHSVTGSVNKPIKFLIF